jgi:carbonic anhydrase
MKQIINQSKTDQCLCCYHWTSRRHFLKSLLPGSVAFTILQSAAPAKAETHQAKALVLSCIDFRFFTAERYFLAKKNLWNNYDWTALAGASLVLAGFPHPSDAEAFWDQLDVSYRLHQINKVIVIDHQDCGAYATMIDPNLSKNPERELQVHTDYLNRAYWLIRNRYSNLEVELYFATLNKAEFQTILPKSAT